MIRQVLTRLSHEMVVTLVPNLGVFVAEPTVGEAREVFEARRLIEPALARKLPKYPLIPATLLGRLAVSSNRRGQGLGTLLLMDALFRSWRNTAEIASAGVVAEAVDDAAVRFYRRHEFIPIAGHGRKLFLAMATIAKAFR